MDSIDKSKVIDMQEKILTKDDLEKDYVDIKQAAQIFNNVSEKTAAKYIKEVSESKGFIVGVVTVTENGGRKKLYKKDNIINISRILNKDKTVVIHVPYDVSESSFGNKQHSERSSDSVPADSNTFQEGSIGQELESTSQKMAVLKSLESIGELKNNFKEFSGNLRELNDNVRNVNMTMQTTISKVIEQGIDLKERYLKDREERTQIEKQQSENLAKQSESLAKQTEIFAKQSEALLELTKKVDNKKSGSNYLIISIAIISVVLIGGGVWFNEYQKSIHQEMETRLDQERQSQKEQLQEVLKTTREELQKMIPITNSTINPTGNLVGK